MTNKSFRIFFAATVLISLFISSKMAFSGEVVTTKKTVVKSKKTKAFYVSQLDDVADEEDEKLCDEIAKILNEPENKKFAEIGFIYGDEFAIPQRYSNFSLPVWEDVKREDLDQYVKSETWVESVEEYEETHPDPKEKLIIQKTTIDLDNDGNEEVVLRFGGQYRFMFIWSIFVSDITPTKLSKAFAAEGDKMNMSENSGILFRYKGKTYMKQGTFGSVSIAILLHGPGDKVGFYHSCFVSLVPSLRKKLDKEWDQIEQEYKSSKNPTNLSSTNN